MAIWDSEIKDITPFNEEWIDPFNGESLLNAAIFAQLIRGYNWLNKEIGVDKACDTSSRPNEYISFPGLVAFPTTEDVANIPEYRMPEGQYINFSSKILGDLYTELMGFCYYYTWGTDIISIKGFSSTDDRYWQLYDPTYDSSSNFTTQLIDIINDIDEEIVITTGNPSIASTDFRLKSNWGKIIKILQEGLGIFKKKKSYKYTRRQAGISVEYIDKSAEYPFENFSYIQKTGESLTTTPWSTVVNLNDDDGYMYPGNNGHNYCPTQKTQYSSEDIYALPSWEENPYANNIFGGREENANNGGFLGSKWAVSGFDSQAASGNYNNPQMEFITQYYYDNTSGPCAAFATYETGSPYTYYTKVSLKNVGWFKLGGSRRKYKLKLVITGLPTYTNTTPICTIKVEPIWVVYPSVVGRFTNTINNELEVYNSNQSSTMTMTALLTGDAYLAQPVLPLPTPSSGRTYGASIVTSGFKYYVNGTELVNDFGYPRITFAVYTSPCGKVYLDYTSL